MEVMRHLKTEQRNVMAVKFSNWDAAEILKTDEDRAAYLDVALEDGDPAVVAMALGAIARSKGIRELSKKTGISREGLYKAFSPKGNPSLFTILSVTKALGLKVTISSHSPKKAAKPARRRPAKRRVRTVIPA